MGISSKSNNKNIKVKVVAKNQDGTIDCSHITSNYKYKALCKDINSVEIGQIVMISQKGTAMNIMKSNEKAQYSVVDTMVEKVRATVLSSQHIMSEKVMYTSVIFRNIETNKRMHSIIDNTSKLFSECTSTLITGDNVELTINNGVIFKIALLD